jgi:hypothetical protein
MINTVEEIKKYSKSLLIIDMDSIAGLSKEYSTLKEDMEVAFETALSGGENKATFTYKE